MPSAGRGAIKARAGSPGCGESTQRATSKARGGIMLTRSVSARALDKLKELDLINQCDSLLTLSDRIPGGTVPSSESRLEDLEQRMNGSIDASSTKKASEKSLRTAGSGVTIVIVIMFLLSMVLAIVQAIKGGSSNVSTSRDRWLDGYPLPMLAFNEAPLNHSIKIQQCTIYSGDYLGRVCVDMTAFVDHDCPELRKNDDFPHYSKDFSWCINSAAFMAATDAARVQGTFGRAVYDYVQIDLLRDSGAPISGFYNIFLYDHTLSLTSLEWTNWVYNYNPVAWSGIEIFFKHVKTVKQNFFLAEEQTNYLTYEHQYTRFDEIGATEGTSERPSVMTFYLRSSLYIEKNILSPDLKADEMLSAIGGSWGFFELLALAAMLAISLLIKCAGLKAPSTTTTEAEAVDSEQKADTAEIMPVVAEPQKVDAVEEIAAVEPTDGITPDSPPVEEIAELEDTDGITADSSPADPGLMCVC